MKILFFSYAYPNPINPRLGSFNRTMIAGLARDHDVHVVSPVSFIDVARARLCGQLPFGLNDRTFQAVENVRADYGAWYYTPKIWRNSYGRFMQRSVETMLDRAIQEFQPEIILSYWTHPDGEVAVNTAHRFGLPAVAMVGGSDVLINARSGSRRSRILSVLNGADGVITVSEDIRRALQADGIQANKLFVARRGVDGNLFHSRNRNVSKDKLGLPADQPVFISVGRLVDVKGHVHLIEACRLLTQRGIKFHCYIIGDGPLRSQLQRQIDINDLSQSVHLNGPLNAKDLADWYRAADFTVLPSLSEGVPNVLLEAMACGTPFVASRVGGIPEIADPQRDALVSAANPVALADAIASRVAMRASQSQSPRLFNPPSEREAAHRIAAILKSVMKGQTMAHSEIAIMHETMTNADLETNRPVPGAAAFERSFEIVRSSLSRISNSSSGQSAILTENADAEPTSSDAVAFSSSKESSAPAWRYEDDEFCRTAEGFFYKP